MVLKAVSLVALAGVATGLLSACGPAGESIGTGPSQDAITVAAVETVSGAVGAGGVLKPLAIPVASSASSPTYTAEDVLAALKTAHGRFALARAAAMDVDYDGTVTPKDARQILQYALQRVPRPYGAVTAWLSPTLFASSYENMKGQGMPQLPLKVPRRFVWKPC